MENGNWKIETVRRIFQRSPFSANFSAFSLFSNFRFPFFIALLFSLAACATLEKPKPEPFYSDAAPSAPQKEFRWSNGGRLPKSFDPALAAAAPETDVVRALYEGLTDTDARTLKTVPAIALDWSTADDDRTWTFKLRRDAKWSNGERVTAGDFARSWKRLVALAGRVPHANLLTNVVGMRAAGKDQEAVEKPIELDLFPQKDLNENLTPPIFEPNDEADAASQPPTNRPTESQTQTPSNSAATKNVAKDASKPKPPVKNESAFGAVAIDDFTLRVSLVKPDADFPALVAHPVFRPVYGDGERLETGKLNADVVTSGAFRVASVSQSDGVKLERSESFWNKSQIKIETVRFVPTENAERALAAYRAGEIDALTNAAFEPLALKLLTPFDDFRRTPHSALNFYEFNRARAPFNDRRIREALTISVERERLTQDELDGASLPALTFLPFATERTLSLSQNAARARNLFAAAGFANGENFPAVRLVVNRNNVQQRVARAVAKMWKQNLNVETQIVVVENAEIEAARITGDFDVLRRGVVLPTIDEAMNIRAIFAAPQNQSKDALEGKDSASEPLEENKTSGAPVSQIDADSAAEDASGAAENQSTKEADRAISESVDAQSREILTEADALAEFAGIPLYFPTAYSLVKPYVRGFDTNTLDAPSLKNVSIDDEWRAVE